MLWLGCGLFFESSGRVLRLRYLELNRVVSLRGVRWLVWSAERLGFLSLLVERLVECLDGGENLWSVFGDRTVAAVVNKLPEVRSESWTSLAKVVGRAVLERVDLADGDQVAPEVAHLRGDLKRGGGGGERHFDRLDAGDKELGSCLKL